MCMQTLMKNKDLHVVRQRIQVVVVSGKLLVASWAGENGDCVNLVRCKIKDLATHVGHLLGVVISGQWLVVSWGREMRNLKQETRIFA